MNEPSVRVLLRRALLVVGVVLLGIWLFAWGDAWLFRLVHGGAFRNTRTRSGSIEVARATREQARTSGVIGRIEIPRLSLSALVLEGTGTMALERGVGHVKGTAFPGESGNVALAGH